MRGDETLTTSISKQRPRHRVQPISTPTTLMGAKDDNKQMQESEDDDDGNNSDDDGDAPIRPSIVDIYTQCIFNIF